VTPFQLSFVTDADEVTGALSPETNEAVALPIAADVNDGALGTLGFSLNFEQVPCA
jgi:hypothetical protein